MSLACVCLFLFVLFVFCLVGLCSLLVLVLVRLCLFIYLFVCLFACLYYAFVQALWANYSSVNFQIAMYLMSRIAVALVQLAAQVWSPPCLPFVIPSLFSRLASLPFIPSLLFLSPSPPPLLYVG